MKGFFNQLLRVNLTSKKATYEEIPDSLLESALGGKGLGVHYLMTENPEKVDPLSPENIFILATGPVTGTKMWGQARAGAYTKSPATGGFGEAYCGGSIAPKIKGCGIDAMIVSGKSEKPVFLSVDENGVRFEDAGPIYGKDTATSEEYILSHSPEGASALVIGPAGENLVRIACIKSDIWRSFGRCGMGAVLGVKNLKGISFCGKKKAEIADEELLKTLIKPLAKDNIKSPAAINYRTYGTPSQVAVTNQLQCFPTRYWYSGYFEKWENLSADYMQENFEVSSNACPNCFLRCTKESVVKNGRHKGLKIEGPEFETIFSIGGLNEIDRLEEVAFLNELCDKLGMDTMSAGNLSAFAIEAYKRGKTGFEIDYNQPDRVAELYEMIAYNKGIGAVLAKGIKKASEELGLEDIAIHVKGLEPAGFDPRVLKGMGLSYATSARGACHLRGTFYKAEISGQMDKDRIEGKAKLMVDYEDRAAVFDCMVFCRFFRDFLDWDALLKVIRATTGMTFSKEELEVVANRITRQTREYNRREGLDDSTDTLPPRFLKEATTEGATLSSEDLATMVSEYNQVRSECK